MIQSAIIKNTLAAILTQVVRGLGAVVISLLIANGFSPAEFGDFRFFQLTVTLLSAIAAPGVVTVAAKYFAQTQIENTQKPTPVAQMWILSLIAAFLVSTICYFATDTFIGEIDQTVRVLFSVTVFFVSANFLTMGAMIGLALFSPALIIEILVLLCFCAGATYSVWTGNLIFAFLSMLVSTIVAYLLGFCIVVYKLGHRKIHESFNELGLGEAAANIFSSLGPMSFVSISIAAIFWAVGYVVQVSNNNPIVFASYSIGMQWFVLASIVPDVIGRVIFPRSVQASATDPENLKKLFKMSFAGALGSSVFVAVVALLLSPYIIGFYGQQYANSTMLIGIYAAVAIPYCLTNTIGYSVVSDNGEKQWVLVSLAQLCATIVTILLVRDMGVMAGAISLLCGALVGLVLSLHLARKRRLI